MNKKQIILIILDIVLVCVMSYMFMFIRERHRVNQELLDQIEQIDTCKNQTTVIYYDRTIQSLKKENKDLYDSLKVYKDKIDLIIKAQYTHKGEIKKVDVDTTREAEKELKTFIYTNTADDTLKYELSIGSYEEPKWYSMKYKLTDNLLIINKNEENLNQMDIHTDNGVVSDVSVIKVPQKTSIMDNIAIGPSIGLSYDFANRNVVPTIGISVTYNLWGKKKNK